MSRRQNLPSWGVNDRRRPAYEYHSVCLAGPIAPEQQAELQRHGWELFSTCGPATADGPDRQCSYHFRRRLESQPLHIRWRR
jgi:hypothetical protein